MPNLLKEFGKLIEGMVKDSLHAVEMWTRWAVASLGGAELLRQWIESSMRDAERRGVDPIPANMWVRLSPHFKTEVLDKTRYRVGGGQWLSLPQIGIKVFGVRAMVLGHIIVFRDNTAASDFWLWVHETVHVVQYARGTIKEFAKRYVQDHKSLEREANEFADKVTQTGKGKMERDSWNWSEGTWFKGPPCYRGN